MGTFHEDAEILSIVNSEDIVIGSARRDKIHSNHLLHRSIHLLIFDSKGRLFLQKRGFSKDESPGLWASSVSGHVDHDESYDDACIRETQEEVGLTLSNIPQRLFKLKASEITGYEFSWVYGIVTDEELIPDPIEIEQGVWLTFDALSELMLAKPGDYAPFFHLLWNEFIRLSALYSLDFKEFFKPMNS